MSVTPDFLRGVDELVRTDFQTFRDSYFNWLLISTEVVILGVLLEGPDLVWEIRELLRRRRLSNNTELPLPTPECHTPTWIILLSLAGWLLVCSGVAGEGIFEALVSKADGLLQTFSNTLLSDAYDRASNAEIIARAFESQIADANRDAETAKAQVAASDLARMQLEAVVSPRSLNLEQQRLIKVSLSRFFGHPAVIVSSYGLDGEGAALGTQLISVIGAATGVAPVDRRAGSIVAGGFETGVQIRGPNSEQDFMSALRNALASIGKLKEVDINGPSVISGAAITAGVSMAAGTAMVGSRESVPAKVPASGPVLIMIGVKPLPVLTAK